jgi:hypothetical protein
MQELLKVGLRFYRSFVKQSLNIDAKNLLKIGLRVYARKQNSLRFYLHVLELT